MQIIMQMIIIIIFDTHILSDSHTVSSGTWVLRTFYTVDRWSGNPRGTGEILSGGCRQFCISDEFNCKYLKSHATKGLTCMNNLYTTRMLHV